ncbi:hypothetical protein M5G11_00205 [Pseudomonas sp. TNT2022 ID681]|uniref:Gamma-glutamylcyclotransferase n=1 Tax=Pseudomonas fontis TaxID=2942633 RepID=A0ABT5NM92_9PSED|nr:hypothetical protein [Pseudomonas fontis]MDD0988957.1 hypothetical protein [Pseudomonas fontis]
MLTAVQLASGEAVDAYVYALS